MSSKLQLAETIGIRDDLPSFNPGDTIKVHYRIIEGEKERIQVFQGAVLGIRSGGQTGSFTVRKISGGVAVERIFPTQSPRIDRIEIVRRGRVRRAKLYYLRGRTGKAARIREKRVER